MQASKLVSVLQRLIAERGDRGVTVSVDVSTGEQDTDHRAFGDIIEVMESGAEYVLLAEGELNARPATAH